MAGRLSVPICVRCTSRSLLHLVHPTRLPDLPSNSLVFLLSLCSQIDGNTFSGRFLGLLQSNSLVFKSTIWTEFFADWLKPYVHYVPVKPDLSDLYEKIE